MGFFDDLFGGGYGKEAAAQDTALAQAYQKNALGALGTQYGVGTAALNKGIAGYQPLTQLGTTLAGAAPTYMGALGVGTPEEIAAAKNAFQMSPGQQYQLDQALQAAQRSVGPGMQLSGNAIIGAETTAEGLTNQYYQQWLNNLMGATQTGGQFMGQAAGGQLAGYGGLANLAQTYGENQANVYGNAEQQQIAANNMAANSQAQGAGNLLNLFGNVAKAGVGLALL